MNYISNTVEASRKEMYKSTKEFSDDRIKRDIREVYHKKDERDHLRWEPCPIEDKQPLLDAYNITLEKLNEILNSVEKNIFI